MAEPERRRDRVKKTFGKLFGGHTSSRTKLAIEKPSDLSAISAPTTSSNSSTRADKPEVESHRAETLSSIRTVLDVANNVLDGCPIWGPKAAAATASQVLKTVQTSLENEQDIEGVVELVQKIVECLKPSSPAFSGGISPELQARLSRHIEDLQKIQATTAKWKKDEKNMVRRLLDAERVAKELESVMRQIDKANWRLLLSTVVSTEGKVDNVQEGVVVVAQTTTRTEGKVGNVQEGVNVLKAQVTSIEQDVLDSRRQLSLIRLAESDRQERALLDRLRPVKEAFHDAPNASEMCMVGTRQELLAELTAWLNNTDPSGARILWINGLAGTGKTTVARTMADWAHQRGRLAAAFFFSRNTETTRSPSAIIPTLAYQFAESQAVFRSHICAGIQSDWDIRDRSVATQATNLFGNLASAAAPDAPLLVVIDALDECHLEHGCEGGHAIPALFTQITPFPFIKILLTSRMEDTIKRMLAKSMKHQIALHDIESKLVQADIRHYLTRSFEKVALDWDLAPAFPPGGAVEKLVGRSGTLFIYAATVIKWVSDSKAQPELRLTQILEQDADELSSQYRPLDQMYAQILSQASETTGNVKVRERALKNIISAVVLLQEPVKASALASLAGEEKQALTVLPLLSAVLTSTPDEPVRLFHPSFPEFVADQERCLNEQFLVSHSDGHLRLATRCLDIMNASLRQDICDLRDPSLFNSEVRDLEQRLKAVAPPQLRYACRYWHVHLCAANMVSPSLIGSLETFCIAHLLHWVELLSLLDDLSSALIGMRPLLTFLRGRNEAGQKPVDVLLADVERLILANTVPIYSSALHVYHSAVTTMPLCRLWEEDARHYVRIPTLQSPRLGGWGSQLRVLEGHEEWVDCVVFSPDGRLIVSGSRDHTIRVWDSVTGVQQYKMQGHKDAICSVTFSPDGQHVISGSYDHIVRLWSIVTGMQLYAMTGHQGVVWSVAFSPNGQHAVSGSIDCKVILWNTTTGAQQRVMSGHTGPVCSVVFSTDGRYIASGSSDHTVRIWDTMTGVQQNCLSGHNGLVSSVAFSLSDQDIISSSHDHTVRVWDTMTGMQKHVMCGHTDSVRFSGFSPNGEYIASGSDDCTVRIWNGKTGMQQNVMSDHEGQISCVAFSPDGRSVISGSHDSTIRMWDVVTGEQQHIMRGHDGPVHSIATSPDGQFIVSGSIDNTVRVWNAMNMTLDTEQHSVSGHEGCINSVVFSLNGLYIVSASDDCTVRVWSVASGAQVIVMSGHEDPVTFAAFSPDSQSIVSSSEEEHMIRVWDTATGLQQHATKPESTDRVRSVGFSSDGQLIIAICWNGSIRTWDAVTGCLIDLPADNSGEPAAQVEQPIAAYSLDEDTGWISHTDTRGGEKRLCWLPIERRGEEVASYGSKVCIGATTGMITILDFSNVLSL